jgi:hypothetical protein
MDTFQWFVANTMSNMAFYWLKIATKPVITSPIALNGHPG